MTMHAADGPGRTTPRAPWTWSPSSPGWPPIAARRPGCTRDPARPVRTTATSAGRCCGPPMTPWPVCTTPHRRAPGPGPLPLLALAQLHARDMPDLPAGPDGCDLLQVFWCPFDAHGPTGHGMYVHLRWRRAAEVRAAAAERPGTRGRRLPRVCAHPVPAASGAGHRVPLHRAAHREAGGGGRGVGGGPGGGRRRGRGGGGGEPARNPDGAWPPSYRAISPSPPAGRPAGTPPGTSPGPGPWTARPAPGRWSCC
ncbi:hypothetical protein SAVIM40S_04826 [Streptomyces avidinii]